MTTRRSRAGWVPRGAVALVVLGVALSGPAHAAVREWQDILERAADAARHTPYAGEALLVSSDGEASMVTRLQVRSSTTGDLVVGGADRWRVSLHDAGGGLVHEGEGWAAPLPAIDVGAGDDFALLEEKYDVAVTGVDHVMARPCTTVVITRRSDGALRERLWVDEASGLLVRRERYEDGAEPVGLAAFLSLDLHPVSARRAAQTATRDVPAGAVDAASERVGGRQLAALRSSGWAVPDALPAGYVPVGVYAVDAVASQPLQLVYSDGLYVVSVFQQRGRPDWSSLPPGATAVEGLGFRAYEWPGAVPRRLVWQAGDRTWSIVGEAPEDELLALAAALPRPDPPGALERMRRGLGTLWAWLRP